MKRRKALLAGTLAIALAVTTVIPGGVVSEAAGKIINTKTVNNAEKAEGENWSGTFGVKNIGGYPTWEVESSETNDNNDNKDYSASISAAVLLAGYGETYGDTYDMTYDANVQKSVSLDLFPNNAVDNMRLGVMLKFIDATHWLYMGWDTNRWFLEWNTGNESSSWGNGIVVSTEVDGEIVNESLPALTQGQYMNIKLDYLAANDVQVSMTPEGGKTVTVDLKDYAATDNTTVAAGMESLEKYASENEKNIYAGLKAGTYQGTITDINLKDFKINGNLVPYEAMSWFNEREGRKFVNDTEHMMGGVDYRIIDASEADADVVVTDTSLTNFENGSVDLEVYPLADNQEFAVDVKYSEEGGKLQFGYNGTAWYYALGESSVALQSGPEFLKDKAYLISLAIEGDNLTASVKAKDDATQPETGESEEETEPSVTDPSKLVDNQAVSGLGDLPRGTIALEAAKGTSLYVANINYTNNWKEEPTELKTERDRVVGEKGETNEGNKYYTDLWTTYNSALTAADAFLDSEEEVTKTPAEVQTLKDNLTTASSNLREVAGSTEVQNLQEKYNSRKENEYDKGPGVWTQDSYSNLKTKLDAAKALLDKVGNLANESEGLATTDLTAALSELAGVTLVERAATQEEKSELKAEYRYDEEFKDVKKEDEDYTDDSWAAFESARDAVNRALESSTTTGTQLKEALDELRDAKSLLAPKMPSSEEKAGLQSLVNGKEGAAKQSDYPNAGNLWTAYAAALNKAKEVAGKSDATLKDVNDAMAALKLAYTNLENYKASLPKTPTALAAPTIKSATAKATKTGVDVEIVINPVSGADHYEVYKAGSKTPLATLKAGITKYTDKNLTSVNTSYSAVAVSKTGIKSAAGAAVKVTTAGTAKLAKVKKAGRKVRITWKKVKTAKQYMIYRSTKKNSGFKRVAVIKKNKVVSYVDKKAKKGKTNFYKLVVVDKSGVASVMSKAKKVKL